MEKELSHKIILLQRAIAANSRVSFNYDNLPRVVEPYHLGILGSDLQLHCYQVSGASHSGGTPEWRNFAVTGMEFLVISPPSFAIRHSYHPENSQYTEIFFSVLDQQSG